MFFSETVECPPTSAFLGIILQELSTSKYISHILGYSRLSEFHNSSNICQPFCKKTDSISRLNVKLNAFTRFNYPLRYKLWNII